MDEAEHEPVHGRVIGVAKITWMSNSMQHAIEILEERQCELRAIIRRCTENSDRAMVACGKQDYSGWLMETERAIECLRDAEQTRVAKASGLRRGDGSLPEKR